MCVNCFGGADLLATNAVLAAGGASAWVQRRRRGRILAPVTDAEVDAFMARLRGEAPAGAPSAAATNAAPADR